MQLNKIGMAMLGLSGIGYAQIDQSVGSETFWLWVALFALAIVGFAILFVTSRQAKKKQEQLQAMLDKQLEIEKKQNLMLINMSENIHDIAKQALEKSNQTIDKSYKSLQHKIEISSNVEAKLLDVTNALLDFLRLKSKKVEIVNESFNINNVLNELSGSICTQFSGSQTELIFDIDKNIPRSLVGDSLHLGQILKNLLEHMLGQGDMDEVRLEISMFDTFDEHIEVQFQFSDTGQGLSPEVLDELFVPYYDEETGMYVNLGLYVANELVKMMGGKLSVHSIEGKGTTFTLFLPFDVVDKSNQRKYRLPEKILIEKKVFIVDTNYNSALAIKKMFAYFRHEVKVLSLEEFMRNIPNLTSFDIVVLHESLFNVRLVDYLKKIKMEKELKVIALNSLLQSNKKSFVNEVIDTHLFKPLNQERVFEMIVDLYNIKTPIDMKEEIKVDVQRAKVHKTNIAETKGITKNSFQDFSGKQILIAEDNFINQKVLISLLEPSGIHVTVANNGQEAVDLVKERKTKFDLVLMDINMPIMDGYTATQMIRLDRKFDGLPIIAFTALVLDSEIQKMFNSGVNAFLSKPLNLGKLYTALSLYFCERDEESTKEKPSEHKEEITYDGLDIQKGIKRASNSEALYMEVLKEFNTAYGNSDEIFVKLIQEHRYEQVKMLCVDMRGLTGTICADSMHDLVTEILQQILYKKYDRLANYKEKYKYELQKLKRSIEKYISRF